MSKHTPTPWVIDDQGDEIIITSTHDEDGLDDDVGCIRIYGGNAGNRETALADAALIVRAVNAHADMLAVLKALQGSRLLSIDCSENRRIGSERYTLREMVNATLDKAEGRI